MESVKKTVRKPACDNDDDDMQLDDRVSKLAPSVQRVLSQRYEKGVVKLESQSYVSAKLLALETVKSIANIEEPSRDEFGYFIDDLPVKRDILREVDLEELVDLEYITEGSSSHIFSASWRDEQVIVKVCQIINHKFMGFCTTIEAYNHQDFFLIYQNRLIATNSFSQHEPSRCCRSTKQMIFQLFTNSRLKQNYSLDWTIQISSE